MGALVRRIEMTMAEADAMCKGWSERALMFEKLKATNVNENSSTKIKEQAQKQPGFLETNTNEQQDAIITDDDGSEEVEEVKDCEEGEEVKDCEEEQTTPMDSNAVFCEDVGSGFDSCTDGSTSPSPPYITSRTQTRDAVTPVRLPTWRPRTRMFQEDSHVIVATHLPGVRLDQLNISLDGDTLVVTGAQQLTGHEAAPSFRNLDVRVALPMHAIHAEEGAATLEGGILQVRFPKRVLRHRRMSPRLRYHRQAMQGNGIPAVRHRHIN